MSDPTATLRRLADACDACDYLAVSFKHSVTECFHEQRQRLADALPGVGWDGATKDLRAMADEVDRLRADLDGYRSALELASTKRDAFRADVERLNAWLERIEDATNRDAATLRYWAFHALRGWGVSDV